MHDNESPHGGQLPDAAPDQAADVAAKLRRAQVRAALFQKPELIRVGRFILLECIGSGAMGEIYTAYDEQLDRKVALKLVRSGSNATSRADARLLREAQTLARLSHPNVVQVYEAGILGERVFIAMELIRGKTLTRWLEDLADKPQRVRVREILRQLIAAGRGLEAAHQAGLTHRDFKPDNVLVGDDGRVRVVDFGLARMVSADATQESAEAAASRESVRGSTTVPEALARTDAASVTDGVPRPLSSNQQRAEELAHVPSDGNWDAGHTVDMASTPALVVNRPARAVSDKAERKAENPAGRPETEPGPGGQLKAALRLTATGAVLGTPRFMAPEQLRGEVADARSDQFSFCVALYHALYGEWPFAGRTLPELARTVIKGEVALPRRSADVPAPVRKALLRGLAREPAERFPDMGALLTALEAWPLRRRRWTMALAAAAMVGAGATAYATLDAPPEPCADVTREIDTLWNPGRRARLLDVFTSTGLPYADVAWRSTSELLDRYAAIWRREARDACEATHVRQSQSAELFDRRMLCLARGTQRFGALLDGLATGDKAMVEHAVEATSSLPDLGICHDTESLLSGLEPPADASVAAAVAEVREHLAEARTEELLGRHDKALELARAQLAATEALPYPPVRAEAIYQVGRALSERGTREDFAEGERLYFEALDLAEGERHDELAIELWRDLVGMAGYSHSSMDRGHAWSRRQMAAVRRMGNRPADLAAAQRALSVLYLRDSKYAEAELELQRAVALFERMPEHRMLLASCLHDLANTLYWGGKIDAARDVFERALAMMIEQLGAAHPKVARLQGDFALLLLELEDFDRSRALLESALEIWKQTQSADQYILGKTHLSLCELETWAGALQRARAHAHTAADIYTRVLAPDHRYHAEPAMCFGVIELRERRFADAFAAFEKALSIRRQHLDDKHLLIGWTQIRVAESLLGLGRYDEALARAEAAQRVQDARASTSTDFRAFLLAVRGRALFATGHVEHAVDVLEQAVALFRELKGYSWERATASWALARALRASGTGSEPRARELAENARAIFAARGPIGAVDRDAIDQWLGEAGTP